MPKKTKSLQPQKQIREDYGETGLYKGAINDLLYMRDIYREGRIKDRAQNLLDLMKQSIPSGKNASKRIAWTRIMESL